MGETQGKYEVVKLQSDAHRLVGSFEHWTLFADGQHGHSRGCSEPSLPFSQLCRSQRLPGSASGLGGTKWQRGKVALAGRRLQ